MKNVASVHKSLIDEFPKLKGEHGGTPDNASFEMRGICEEMAQLLVFWLYRRSLPEIGPDLDDAEKYDGGHTPLIDLYLMAEIWDMPEFREAVMSRIDKLLSRVKTWFDSEEVAFIYKQTTFGHPLRQYAVRKFLEYSERSWPELSFEHFVMGEYAEECSHFVDDCCSEVVSRLHAAEQANLALLGGQVGGDSVAEA